MSIQLYQLIHIFSVIILASVAFASIAAPRPETRRFSLMVSGIVAVLALVSGFGLLARLGLAFQGWLVIKLVCWVALSALVGIAYRRPGQTQALTAITTLAVLLAVYMVIFKPF